MKRYLLALAILVYACVAQAQWCVHGTDCSGTGGRVTGTDWNNARSNAQRIDNQTAVAFGAADTTPDVSGQTYIYKTGGAVTITDFDDGTDHTGITDGRVFKILVQHAVTLDCTASQINCNGGADFTAADGDVIDCTFDDTTDADGQWLCTVSNPDGSAGGGDVTAVGDCLTGACFTGASGTTLSSNTDLIFDLDEDNNGTESLQILDGADALVVEVLESGLITTLVGIDAIGAVDMDYGSADVTDHTFLTDGTGDAEIVLPTGSISGTEILDDTVVLTTDTAGNYVASITNGAGITGGDGGSEGAALTLAATLGTAIDTTEITDDTISFSDIDYLSALTGDIALLVDECYLAASAIGGGFVCEGSTADASEQAYLFPDVNGADTTNRIVVDNTEVTSIDGDGLTITAGVLAADLSTAIDTSKITNDTIDFTDIKQDNTLAGNPTLAVDECFFIATTGGGGFICEGSTADTSEQAYLFPDVNGADTTQEIVTDSATQTLTNKTIDATNTVTINASDITDQNAGTDITADLEEETHASEHDSTFDLDASGETLVFQTDSTLAGNPALGAEACVFSNDGTGGVLLCEGITADLIEGLIVWSPTTSDRTLTLPDATDTLVGRATTDTLTNKTIDETNTVTINASDITDQNAGTDITADLEEEGVTCTGCISSADIEDNAVSGTDIAVDTIDFTEITDSGAIDADTTFTAADGISLTLTPSHTSGDTNFFVLDSNQVDDAAATDDFDVMRIEMLSESGDAGDTYEGLVISQEAGVANTVIDAAIRIENLENLASTMTDAIKIEATTADAIVDAIDVSDAEITNAINIGANPIAFSTGSLSATDLELLDDGAIDLTAEVSGTLPVGSGGTGATTLTDGGILLGSGTGAITALGVAANGQIPIGDGTTDPVLATISQGAGNEVTVTNGAGTITLDIGADTLDTTEIDETADYSFTTLSGKQDRNNTAVNDDSCATEQGLWWYDTTDSRFEFCNGTGDPSILGYVIKMGHTNFAAPPSSTSNIVFGGLLLAPTTTTTARRIYLPMAGTITAAYCFVVVATGSNESVTYGIRLNDSTTTTISTTVDMSGSNIAFSNTSLSIAVSAGDFIAGYIDTPAWVTPPTNLNTDCQVLVEQN